MTSLDAHAETLACGPGGSFCKSAMKSMYEDGMRSDACAVETYSSDQNQILDYHLWLPSYASKTQRGSAFVNASADANRFAPKQVNQESFLQGRGQVSSNPNCKAGFLRYLPEDRFEKDGSQAKQPWDMTLFSQQSIVPRSCASITELDLFQRMKPIAQAYQGRWSPLVAETSTESGGRRRYEEGQTLSTKRVPSFAEMAARGKYA